MEYVDLSVYSYYAFPLEMRNVGWLGPVRGLPHAGDDPLPEADVALLRAASRRLTNVMLGFHQCPWCGYGDPLTGNGEYHYYAPDGAVYAAPAMVLHYVQAHGYRPPDALVVALRTTGELAWDWRAERLADVLADASNDFEFRCTAIGDLAAWACPQALDALLRAAHDPVLIDVAGDEIGRSIGQLMPYEFAADVRPDDLHPWVRQFITAGSTLP